MADKNRPVIAWTPEMLERLKKAYEQNKDAEVFTFDGHEFVPRYVYYLIEFLEQEFKKGGR